MEHGRDAGRAGIVTAAKCEACGRANDPLTCRVESYAGRTLCGHCRERRERIATAVIVGLARDFDPYAGVTTRGRENAPVIADLTLIFADALMGALDKGRAAGVARELAAADAGAAS